MYEAVNEDVNPPGQPGQWEWPHSTMALGVGSHLPKHPGAPQDCLHKRLLVLGEEFHQFPTGIPKGAGCIHRTEVITVLGPKITLSQMQRKDLEQLLCTPQFPTMFMGKNSKFPTIYLDPIWKIKYKIHDQAELKHSSVSFHNTGLIFTRICLWIVTRPANCFLEFLTMAIKGGEIIFKISF